MIGQIKQTTRQWTDPDYLQLSNTDVQVFNALDKSAALPHLGNARVKAGIIPADAQQIDNLTPIVATHAYFGDVLASTRDGTRVAIGATLYRDTSNNQTGCVSIMVRAGSDWVLEENLLGEDVTADTSPGFARALSFNDAGDLLAVGSFTDSSFNGSTNSGSVFLYTRTGATWTFLVRLDCPNPGTATAYFGASLKFSGNGDTLVIGEPAYSTVTGRTHVFIDNAGTWEFDVTLTPSISANFTDFGRAVDINQAGTRIISGAPKYSSDRGALEVYQKLGTSWSSLFTVFPSVVEAFGSSVSMSDDGDLFIVGSPSNNSNTGRARIYQVINSAAVELLILEGPSSSDYFGVDVGISGDGRKCGIGANSAGYSSRGRVELYNILRKGRAALSEISFDQYIDNNANDGGVPGTNTNFGKQVVLTQDAGIAAISDAGYLTNTGAVYILQTTTDELHIQPLIDAKFIQLA